MTSHDADTKSVNLSGVLLRAAVMSRFHEQDYGTNMGVERCVRQLYQHLQEVHARHMHGEDGTKLLDEFFELYTDLDAPSGLEVKRDEI